jgi:[lysine-biosynthesis-protein LysW]--L-2-aminoadipate ligase
VINSFDVANTCGNKMITSMLLKKNNIPTPRTYFSFTAESAMEHFEKVGYPLVIKPIIGSWGRSVMPIKDKDTADAIIENRQVTDGPQDRIYYLQEMIDRPPRDIRVITVGDQPIAAMYRKSSGGFKTNIALGADPEICKITNEIEDLCVKTSKAVGGGILGIDLMEDKKKGLVVHEVNNTVEFKGLVKVAEKNIPKAMIDYAINYIKR